MPFCGAPPRETILRAINALQRVADTLEISRLFVSPSWPDARLPAFVNAAVAIRTGLSPKALLAALNAIEAGFGRRRAEKNAPRTLDLDLLDYHRLATVPRGAGDPILPHPGIAHRDFVLAPLEDVAPDWVHPVVGLTPAGLRDRLGLRTAVPIASDRPL